MDEFTSRHYPVREDMRFQRRSWIAERAGWIVLAVIALAGLTGIFGTGPLSWQVARSGTLTVHYDRFQRRTRLAAFRFDVAHTTGPELTLTLGGGFARDFDISSIAPPVHSVARANGLALTFTAQAGASSRIIIWAHSHSYGRATLTAAVGSSAPASFWVFVYP